MYIDGCVSFPFPVIHVHRVDLTKHYTYTTLHYTLHTTLHTYTYTTLHYTTHIHIHIHYTTLHYTNYVDEIYINQHPAGGLGGERYDMTLTHLESNQIKIRSDSD